ncbi:hypothetical protein VTJ04DRAFT_4338 [Mycothermus thermophilus]|uniref:uncharacterized protein n=1 Tax=Humicola insolens TaxID=85995 RepID=UPI003744AF48
MVDKIPEHSGELVGSHALLVLPNDHIPILRAQKGSDFTFWPPFYPAISPASDSNIVTHFQHPNQDPRNIFLL